MNGQHLRAFFWLQWRLRVNQMKRGGVANAIIAGIFVALGLIASVVLFVVFLLIGLLALSDASPVVVMLIWDGIAGGFLFFWTIGLMADLQRSEALALTKFLHLPVSLSGVFVLNYVSSLLSINLILFAPMMLGLSIGLICSRGPGMLVLLPLAASFLVMVTALTYQFQGWLASLMANKRRRRTVIVIVTAVFILIAQLPNLINIMQPWKSTEPDKNAARFTQESEALHRALVEKKIDGKQFQEQHAQLQRDHKTRIDERRQEQWATVDATARLINLIVPAGWLPLGAAGAAEGGVLTALLCIVGMASIGAGSLWRAYRTTVRMYVGGFTTGTALPPSAPAPTAVAGPAVPGDAGMLERNIPWLSEQAAAVALGGFRSLTRAPEVKMMLLTPVILAVIFGASFLRQSMDPPVLARPLIAFGAVAMILLTMAQLVGNQFGFDRGGFRIYVLGPAPRRDILLGKNVAIAPIALTLGAVSLAFVQIAYPMRLDHFLASFVTMISMYLLFCLLANCLSIMAPMPVAAGSMRPSHSKMVPVLLHMLLVLVFPVALAPTLAPLGVEALLDALDVVSGWPICLGLALLECGGLLFFFRWLIGWQGVWLQAREQRIMEIVTTKAE